jgi:hypothetical protein
MDCLADYISNSPSLLALIPQCSNVSFQIEFVESALAFLRTQQINYKSDGFFSYFIGFISSSLVESGLKASVAYPSIAAAFTQFRENRSEKKKFKNNLMADFNLWSTIDQDEAILASVLVYYVDRLPTPYSPINTCVYETDIIGEQWRYQLEHGKQADI